jgi:hypothetical protein
MEIELFILNANRSICKCKEVFREREFFTGIFHAALLFVLLASPHAVHVLSDGYSVAAGSAPPRFVGVAVKKSLFRTDSHKKAS